VDAEQIAHVLGVFQSDSAGGYCSIHATLPLITEGRVSLESDHVYER
jgi:hypothetical protein